jgi:hypothetical protein
MRSLPLPFPAAAPAPAAASRRRPSVTLSSGSSRVAISRWVCKQRVGRRGGGGPRGAVSIQPLSHTEDLQTLSDSSGRISISACACTREHIAWMCMSPIDKHLTAARCCISSLTSSSQSSCNSSPRRASHEAHSPFSHDAPGALRTSGTTAAS